MSMQPPSKLVLHNHNWHLTMAHLLVLLSGHNKVQELKPV